MGCADLWQELYSQYVLAASWCYGGQSPGHVQENDTIRIRGKTERSAERAGARQLKGGYGGRQEQYADNFIPRARAMSALEASCGFGDYHDISRHSVGV